MINGGYNDSYPLIESRKILLSGYGFYRLLEPSQKKYTNPVFWCLFDRLLEPMQESPQIDASGTHFVDFWGQGWKIFKSELLELIL
jgi:hypothetical protein